MFPTTLKELKTWLAAHNYHFGSYALDDEFISEGYGIDKYGPLYVFYYTERGERRELDYFGSEKEITAFLFEKITSDSWAQKHLVGFLQSEEQAIELINELNARNISYEKDEIPYSILEPKMRIRVFVDRSNIAKAADLRLKYC